MPEDWYEILELSPNASAEEIKKQYRFLCQVWHPDKFSNALHKARAEERMKKINAAYDVLSDPRKRRDNDAGRGPSQSGAEARQQREAEEQRRRQQEQRQREEERRRQEEQHRQQEAERRRWEEQERESDRKQQEEQHRQQEQRQREEQQRLQKAEQWRRKEQKREEKRRRQEAERKRGEEQWRKEKPWFAAKMTIVFAFWVLFLSHYVRQGEWEVLLFPGIPIIFAFCVIYLLRK